MRSDRPGLRAALFAMALSGLALAGCDRTPALSGSIAGAPELLDQSPVPGQWTPEKRRAYYTQDQGSQLIPLAWARALTTADGQPFLRDQLARYGYLPNPDSGDNLPVGFTTSRFGGAVQLGLNCAACHTRQISVDGKDYRVDGGPAIADFQSLLVDLVDAVGRVRASDTAFERFAGQVLGTGATPVQRGALHDALDLWFTRESAMVKGALPHAQMWGLGRLDAVSMIFNRLAGLDIGPAPSHVIAANIQPADAPVRYPFVWNAPVQDKTQWPGFADNGDPLLGLARNAGEVFGVFATMHPAPQPLFGGGVDFRKVNSANFGGLARLEALIADIGPPKYPWPVNAALAARGGAVFAAQCAGCHGESAGIPRLLNTRTWHTPLQDVGTDAHEYTVLARTAQSGVLQGGRLSIFNAPIGPQAKVFDLLGFSVIGSIAQGGLVEAEVSQPARLQLAPLSGPQIERALKGAFTMVRGADVAATCDPTRKQYCYEARVLHGIWATAPYLHNGSVPTLDDLLKPSDQRPARFAVGRAYDIARLGLATSQPQSGFVRTTTGCDQRDSGDSRCGHEGAGFGTTLGDADRKALLEYLKTL
jgi:hypothetical protein